MCTTALLASVFTPSGDGINDEAVFEFSVVLVGQQRDAGPAICRLFCDSSGESFTKSRYLFRPNR